MKSIYIGLAAALCWTGALSVNPEAAKDGVDVAAMAARRRHLRSRFGSSHVASLGLRQAGVQCGPNYGRCPDDLCCSEYGFCGDSVDHCHPLFDCQTQYGYCGWPRLPPTTTRVTTTSSTSTTSSSSTTTTTSSTSTTTTTSQTSTSTSIIPIPTGELQVTTNGQCGNNTMCIGNPNYGPCCSQHFWCGSSMEYCGPGCRAEFGACLGIPGLPGYPSGNETSTTTPPGGTTTTPTSTSSTTTTSTTTSAAPSFTLPPGQRSSTDGRCGNGVNCLGSQFGRCCSQFGWCGDGDQYCPYIVGCQPEFGYCDPR
ncbi:hypothetical protein VTJ49DRAFT_6667 [Mycothermus thermophilus]|uniref:Chitin-binding type-1 domain-containing protein n=1 Tax=Humicola insolens TaxID=85995 RepID=A0ABR3VJ75_HUMIN